MKISVLFIPKVSNPQYSLLKSTLISNECNVETNINEFWNPTSHYEILHIQYPEFLYGYDKIKNESEAIKKTKRIIEQLRYFYKKGTKIVWTAFNLKGHEQKSIGKDNLVYFELSKLCHAVITMGKSYHDQLKAIYPSICGKPIVVIPHGNYINTYPNKITTSDAKTQLKIKDNNFVLIYFGLQRKYKDVYFIYKAFRRAQNNNKNLLLLIVGQPWGLKRKIFFKYIKYFHTKIEVISKYIEDENIQIYFNASDVAIFAFKNMITSGSIPLAQSFGLPVIAPNIGCFPDIIPKTTGFLYENNNVEDCANIINTVIQSNYRQMGKNAMSYQKSISWNNIGKQTKLLYDQILSQ